jgi:hypothetical protein
MLLTRSKISPAMLLYRKFSPFTGFQLAKGVKVRSRQSHVTRQPNGASDV